MWVQGYTQPSSKTDPTLGSHWACLSLLESLCPSLCPSLCLCLLLSVCIFLPLCVSGQSSELYAVSSNTALHRPPRIHSQPRPPSPPTTLSWAFIFTLRPTRIPATRGTDRVRVRTIQGAWPSEGTASSIRGWVLTKLRISSGKALEALYCMPGAAQHPGLGGEGVVRAVQGSPYRGSDSPWDPRPCPKAVSLIYVMGAVELGNGQITARESPAFGRGDRPTPAPVWGWRSTHRGRGT